MILSEKKCYFVYCFLDLRKPGKYILANKGINNPMYGKNHTLESIQKMSKNAKRSYGIDNGNFGRVYQEEEKTYDTWELTNNIGNTIIIKNLNKFCKEHNLNASCVRDVYYGRMKKYKCWVKVNKLTNNVKKKAKLN